MLRRIFFAIIVTFGFIFNANSQYCLNGGPTTVDDSNVESVTLFGESGSNIQHTGCPAVLGVEDLTSNSVFLNAGSSYNLDVQFGTCGGNYGGVGEVWIDFNNDQIFDVAESIGTWSGTPPTSLSNFNFTVPFGANNSTTRMRVMQRESGSLPLDPCDNYSWGSVMDFTVIIQNGIDCSGYEGNYPSNAIEINSFPFSDSKSTSFCYSNTSPVYTSPDVFYKLKVNPQTSHIKASLCGSNFDTHISIQDTGLTAIFYNDDSDSCAPQSEIYFPTTDLDSIYIVVEGYGNDTGTFILNVEEFKNGEPNRIESQNYNQESKIYPNPTKSKFSISGISEGKVKVFNVNGKLLIEELNNFKNIDVSILNSGIYLVQIIENGSVDFKELIIN